MRARKGKGMEARRKDEKEMEVRRREKGMEVRRKDEKEMEARRKDEKKM